MKLALSMRTKVLALCISCTVLALVLQSVFFRYSASAIIYRQEQESSLKALTSMQDELYSWIKGYENNLIKIYNQTDFTRDLGGSMTRSELEAAYRGVAYGMALADFDPAQGVNALYIYTADDQLVSVYRSASTPRINYPADIFQDPSASNAQIVSRYVRSADRVMLMSSTFNASRREDLVRFVLKIYSSGLTRTVGYLVCDVDGAGFFRIMEKYLSSDRQVIWLQPSEDRPALRLGTPAASQARVFEATAARVSAGTWSDQDRHEFGADVLQEVPQEKYNLSAFSLTPLYLLEENQRILTRNMLLAALIVITVAALSAMLISRSLTTPLSNIMLALTRIRNGETELRLQGLKSDEIGALGRTINDMLDRIQELIAQVYSAKLLLKQAEYKALQAQVNPHFLYNSLDTMGSIASAQRCDTVSMLCQALSHIFRYCIDMQDPLSTVGNEIVHLKNYMYVMNVRMQNAVTLDITVDRSLLSERIPRLTLQPVVENALHHGLRDKEGEKRVAIHGRREDGSVVLEVTDNGVGMDAEDVTRLLEHGGALERSSSIGLGNIHARIRLLFGDAFGVRVHSVKGQGSTVSLTVPAGSERATDAEGAAEAGGTPGSNGR